MYICIKHTYVYTVHLLLHACHFRDILKMKTCKNKGLRKKKSFVFNIENINLPKVS